MLTDSGDVLLFLNGFRQNNRNAFITYRTRSSKMCARAAQRCEGAYPPVVLCLHRAVLCCMGRIAPCACERVWVDARVVVYVWATAKVVERELKRQRKMERELRGLDSPM